MRIHTAVAALLVFLVPSGVAAQQAPAIVDVIQAKGTYCAESGLGDCTYDMDDPIWTRLSNDPPAQGLTWPTVGPAARGPFAFRYPLADEPNVGSCTGSGGAACALSIEGTVGRGPFPGGGDGSYCRAVGSTGAGTYTASDGTTFTFTVDWTLAPVFLPVSATSDGGRTLTMVLYARASGTDGGDCGQTRPTSWFFAEGFAVVT